MNFENSTIFTVAEMGSVNQLIEKLGSKNLFEQINEKKENLLHCAIIGKNKEVFDFLIVQGKKFDTPNYLNETPLHYLTKLTEKDFVLYCSKIMLEKGFDINKEDNWGNNPFFSAVINCDYEDYDVIKLMLNYRPNVSKENKSNMSVLKIAEEDDNKILLELLRPLL